jgi:hypothetical protein
MIETLLEASPFTQTLVGLGLLVLGFALVTIVQSIKLQREPSPTRDPERFYDEYPAFNPDGTQYRGPKLPRAIPGTRQAAPADWKPASK